MLFLGDAWRYWYEIDTVSHKLFKESFLLQKFFEKMESKEVTSTKTRKTDIFESVRLRGVQHTVESTAPKFSKKLCGVHHIVESSSAVCIILQSQAPWCASHSGVELPRVHPTAEPSSTYCIIPGSQWYQRSQKTKRCASHRRVKLHGVHPTAEQSSAVCFLPRSSAVCITLRSHEIFYLHFLSWFEPI